MAKTRLWLVTCVGMGDTYIRLVDKPTWDWIHSPRPVFVNHSAYELDVLPPPVLTYMRHRHARERDWRDKSSFPGVFVTSGTCENDRALSAPSAVVGNRRSPLFFSAAAAARFVVRHKIKIVAEYSGGIY